MSYSLPIITTKCYGINDQVSENVNALLYNFKDYKKLTNHINLMLDDDNKRYNYSKNSLYKLNYKQNYSEMNNKLLALVNDTIFL